MKLLAISINKNVEFSIIGIANVANATAKFQGLLNGVPFTENEDYNVVRGSVMDAVAINQPQNNEALS